jgi:hypothetical protein
MLSAAKGKRRSICSRQGNWSACTNRGKMHGDRALDGPGPPQVALKVTGYCLAHGGAKFASCCGGRMAEVLGTWEGVERRVGAIRRRLMDKPGMDLEVLAKVRARLERVLEQLVADGRVWIERPDVTVDLHALLAEIDRRAALR